MSQTHVLHAHFLKRIYGLIRHRNTIDLFYFIEYMEGRLFIAGRWFKYASTRNEFDSRHKTESLSEIESKVTFNKEDYMLISGNVKSVAVYTREKNPRVDVMERARLVVSAKNGISVADLKKFNHKGSGLSFRFRTLKNYHGLVGVLLKLYQPDSGDIFDIHVSILALDVISAVEVRKQRRRSYPRRFFSVNFVACYIVSLQ
ncbi:Protein of unknown function [Cotesia congregata]|uniref:Uncharacterized protein n=1 Tax=Cotesia congregata TaxID=51543 RepID=A0A8J2EDL4_COTCN|nr:Protein of unknown function [Cotesia congregata]